MRIVHVEDFFHPNAGYQINILPKYMTEQGYDVYIITSEMDKIPNDLTKFFGEDNIEKNDRDYMNKTGVKIIRIPVKSYISGRAIFENTLYNQVDELNPDIVYVHGNDTWTGIRYLLKAAKLPYPIIMDSHMLEMASTNKLNKVFRYAYKKFITPIIKRNNIKVIRTQNDRYVEKCLGIPLEQCPWISVGSDTMLFNVNNKIKNEFREEHGINKDAFVIIYTGKLDESKGGMLLAETLVERFESNKYTEVVILIVGNTSGEYGQKVDKLLRESNNRIIRFSTQKYTELARFYQSSDMSIFPKQCSLSFYDAQACGLPVVSEDNNINIDRLKFDNGLNFKSGNAESFREKIQTYINMDKQEYDKIKLNAHKFVEKNYNYRDIANKYMEIVSQELDNQNKGLR